MKNRQTLTSARWVATSTVLILLAGCATRTPFKLPESGLPENWKQGAIADKSIGAAQVAPVPAALLQDTQLRLLLVAVENSDRGLAVKALEVRKAQLQADLAGNALWPQPTAGAGSTLLGGVPTSRSYEVSTSLGYKVDLWNELGKKHDIATREAQATDQALRDHRITLLATASELYFRLGRLNDSIRLNAENLNNAKRTLTLVQAQYTYGAASALELAQARQALQGQEGSFAKLVQDRLIARNELSVLGGGQNLSAYEPSALPAYDVAPLPAGLPVSLLSQRPDLRATEMRLRNTLESVDVARVSFYPTISLDARTDLLRVLSDPIGTLTANIALPFLNIGKARLTTAVAQAEFDKESLKFQQALLTAFTEVDDALSAGVQLRQAKTHLGATLEDARIAERLYEARYREGTVALRDWIEAQDKRRQAEEAVIQNRYDRYTNVITVLKRLGVSIPIEQTRASDSSE
ncbi:TolC family protein [Cupriavidus sp. CP313]